MDPHDLHILHEDNHLLAVVKPAGLLAQGDRTGDATLLDVAKSYLRVKYDKAHLANYCANSTAPFNYNLTTATCNSDNSFCSYSKH